MPINMRAAARAALLLAWAATAYRLPHLKWKSGEVEEHGDGKSVGDESVEATIAGADKSTVDFLDQHEKLENAHGAKVPVGEVLEAVMKEHDSKEAPRLSSRSHSDNIRNRDAVYNFYNLPKKLRNFLSDEVIDNGGIDLGLGDYGLEGPVLKDFRDGKLLLVKGDFDVLKKRLKLFV